MALLSEGVDDFREAWVSSSLTNLAPVVEQISSQESSEPFEAAKAWEIDGARVASKIAKHAIQAAKFRVIRLTPI
jgi:hypothetical protein